MSAVLAESAEFVTPDCIYDYFEPLLRKEMYTSPLHRVYELARASLSHVEPVSLEARIIKTVAAIDAVAQYDRVEPTKETLFDLSFVTVDWEQKRSTRPLRALSKETQSST